MFPFGVLMAQPRHRLVTSCKFLCIPVVGASIGRAARPSNLNGHEDQESIPRRLALRRLRHLTSRARLRTCGCGHVVTRSTWCHALVVVIQCRQDPAGPIGADKQGFDDPA